MPFSIWFLEADEPLTKRLELSAENEIIQSSYLNAAYFTSHEERVSSCKDLYHAVVKHAKQGHCLLKGKLHRSLHNERRAGATNTDDTTQWLCLDLDKAPFKTPEEFMAAHPLLKDVSYVVQYSTSQGLPNPKGLSCHIYVLLSHPYHAPYIKAWLMQQNLDGTILGGALRQAITLTATATALHYPLDITTCQNDKLIYLAFPVLGKGVKYTLKEANYIQLVPKKLDVLPIERLQSAKIDVWKKEAEALRDSLRVEQKLVPLKSKTRIVGEFEIQPKPGEAVITGMRQERGFTYFNLNGGDSWGYYHPDNNFELIHNFKSEPSYYTKELLPGYYRQKKAKQVQEASSLTDDGDLILAFRHDKTGSYYNGTWNAAKHELKLYPAKSELQINHFLQAHGIASGIEAMGGFIPIWRLEFNPQSEIVCDEEAKYINTYVSTPWYRLPRSPAKNLDKCPIIKRLVLSAVSNNEWNDTTEHFLNWLAVIFQQRAKTTTAWVLHGTEGTGKGLLVHRVLRPLLGERYVKMRRMSELEEKFTGWLEDTLIAFIDEVHINASQRKELITADLKNQITEETISIRHMNRIAYDAKNYTNFILGSNMPDMVRIDDRDRRFNIGDYQAERLIITSNEIAQIHEELPFFMDYIMQRPACRDTAAQVLKTAARDDVINANRNSVDILAEALRDGDITPFLCAMPDIKTLAEIHGANAALGMKYANIMQRELDALLARKTPDADGFHRSESRLTRDELFVLFEFAVGNMPRSPNKFTRLLKHKRIETKRMRINDDTPYGVEVVWTAPKEWVDEYREQSTKPAPLKVVKGSRK